MNCRRKYSAKNVIAYALTTALLAFSDVAIGQTFSYSVVKNGEFTNLIDEDGNFAFSIVRNGQFTNLVDKDGNFVYSFVQNGQFTALVDQNGNAAFSITYNGGFLILTPVPAEKPRRSEINKEMRQRVEIAANAAGLKQQQQQIGFVAAAQKVRQELRTNREKYKAIGFADEELDRLERVLIKFEESNTYLSKHPEPIRHLTGIAESHADFEKRHGQWNYDARSHLKMNKLCREEITKFMEKYNRLTGN